MVIHGIAQCEIVDSFDELLLLDELRRYISHEKMSSRSSSYSTYSQGLPKPGVTRQLASNTLAAMHRRYNFPGPPTHARPLAEFRASANRAMDLLRQNIQSSVSKEIDQVIRKYLEKFFVPAVANIRSNLGDDSVGEDQVKAVCRAMLDATRSMYAATPRAPVSPCDFSDSESSSGADSRLGRPNNSPSFNKRHWETDSDTGSVARRKRFKPSVEAESAVSGGASGFAASIASSTSSSGPSSRPPSRHHYDPNKWNPDRLSENTVFMMGSHAHKLLGLGQSRGRLYSKHPEIMRYPADTVDKEWIANNGLMNPVPGKPYIMVLEDIEELAATDQYRSTADLRIPDMITFRAPPFMLSKMKSYLSQRITLGDPMSPLSPSPSTPTSLDHTHEIKTEPLKTEFKEESCSDNFNPAPDDSLKMEQINIYEPKNEILDCFDLKDDKVFISSNTPMDCYDIKEEELDSSKAQLSNIETMQTSFFDTDKEFNETKNVDMSLFDTDNIPVEFYDNSKEQPVSFITSDVEYFGDFLPQVESEADVRNTLENVVGSNPDNINLAPEDFDLETASVSDITKVIFTPPHPPAQKYITVLTSNGLIQNIPILKCETTTESNATNKTSIYTIAQDLPGVTTLGASTSAESPHIQHRHSTIRIASPAHEPGKATRVITPMTTVSTVQTFPTQAMTFTPTNTYQRTSPVKPASSIRGPAIVGLAPGQFATLNNRVLSITPKSVETGKILHDAIVNRKKNVNYANNNRPAANINIVRMAAPGNLNTWTKQTSGQHITITSNTEVPAMPNASTNNSSALLKKVLTIGDKSYTFVGSSPRMNMATSFVSPPVSSPSVPSSLSAAHATLSALLSGSSDMTASNMKR